MSPFLRRFFQRMEQFVQEHPDDPAQLVSGFEGWDVDPARVGLYGRFIQLYPHATLSKLFTMCRELTEPARWDRLLADYYPTRSANHWEINSLGAGFPEHVSQDTDLPPYLADLALFEWTSWQVYSDETELPPVLAERGGKRSDRARLKPQPTELTVNPTLQCLQLSWDICRYTAERGRESDPLDPPGEQNELALIWRNPTTLRSRFYAADARALLALKVVGEGIDPTQAALEGGVSREEIEQVLSDYREHGLLLGP